MSIRPLTGISMTNRKLVIQNIHDEYGRVKDQMFGVWDSKTKLMVLPFDWRKDARQRAEAFLSQLEFQFPEK
jgi:hypothetical protein